MRVMVVGAAELTAAGRAELRAMLDGAFDGDFDDDDWAHATGGAHVLAFDGDELVGHASVVGRTLWYDGRPLRTGYVEAVAVRHGYRGRGRGTAVMEQVAALIEREYELGALASAELAMPLYRRLGWRLWLGPTHVNGPDGRVPTPDEDGGVFVLTRPGGDPDLDLTEPLTCDWRTGDVW
ncbi:aminoglycoside N-acetyltransferase AAC(2')-Ie [Catellatospora sp. IY07-71]|uniref:GNAT family N-acetyltransferase n=1 Tax=Catellatospora sp. IY07-71 TaxID=2728827 RepID=UPI001BB43BD2|nr:GNAT family N-acetyltransferase [Catellatospora sp. IY07-71]BCJ75539.1 aminoglycoside N-acetyltransferase AAC(2')-Ie [Catellatospora sp. IY07-71]